MRSFHAQVRLSGPHLRLTYRTSDQCYSRNVNIVFLREHIGSRTSIDLTGSILLSTAGLFVIQRCDGPRP